MVLVWVAISVSAVVIAGEQPGPRKALAILVGVENYNRLTDLWCSNSDVALLEETLLQYGACNEIVTMTDGSDEKFKPTLGNILAVLDTRLKYANEGKFDRVIIFFAGHGKRDSDGRLYFAPQDCTESLIQQTGLSVALIREMLERCQGIGEKILILDTCHAGSQRGSASGPSGGEFAQELRDTRRTFTLASCQADELSLEWNEKGHGLFTYWLCEGLSGAADRKPYGNENGRVDTNELTVFVIENVERTSRDLVPQTPVAMYSDGKEWKADLAYIPPELDEAEQTALVDSLLAEANKYRRGGNYAAAIDQINHALECEKDNPEALALRGLVHLAKGKSRDETVDPDLAGVDFWAGIDDFKRAIPLGHEHAIPDEQLASWHFSRCEAYYQLGEYELALKDAHKVIELQPTSAQAYLNRAKLYRHLDRIAEAEADEREARERSGAAFQRGTHSSRLSVAVHAIEEVPG